MSLTPFIIQLVFIMMLLVKGMGQYYREEKGRKDYESGWMPCLDGNRGYRGSAWFYLGPEGLGTEIW